MDLEIEIEKLAYGRAGLGRFEGKVVFVDRVAPGDRVSAKVVREASRYLEAELLEVLQPGAARVEPPCPIADRCGGCPWQQVAYGEQLAAKGNAVVDALERVAGLSAPPVRAAVPAPGSLGYRNRLKLRFEGGRLGFYQARSNSLVPVPDCLLAEPRVRQALAAVERFVASLATKLTRVEIASRGELPGVTVSINSAGRLRRADTHRARDLVAADDNPVAGLYMWGRGWQRQWGDPTRTFIVDDDGTWVSHRGAGFGQVNHEANRLLVSAVTEAAAGAATVLELYAGAGNFSLPLAKRCGRVTAVEADESAVEAGRAAAREQRLGNLRFVASAAEAFAASYRGDTPEVLVVDPPRSGLGDAAAVAGLGAPRALYVSCNPATLARDLAAFFSAGYRLESATPFDLFPQTFHVETMCRLELT